MIARSIYVYKILKAHGELIGNDRFDFFKLAESFGNNAIILSPENLKSFNMAIPQKGEVRGNYKLVDIVDNEFYIFKLM